MLDAITVSMMSAKPASHIPQSPRLLDQLREVLRYRHYSLRTEEAYLYWVKFFVRWHGRNGQVCGSKNRPPTKDWANTARVPSPTGESEVAATTVAVPGRY